MFEVNHNTRTLLQWWKGGEGWDLFKEPGNSEETVLTFSRQTCQLWDFLKNISRSLIMRGWDISWLCAYFKQIWYRVLCYWAELLMKLITRIQVNTALVLWAPHINSHSNSLCCVQSCAVMFRDSVLGNCSTFKSSYFYSTEDSGNIENPKQFTFNKEIGTFRTQRTVKICDFHNTRYQHFVHTAISASKPACKRRLKEKLMDLKYPYPS